MFRFADWEELSRLSSDWSPCALLLLPDYRSLSARYLSYYLANDGSLKLTKWRMRMETMETMSQMTGATLARYHLVVI